MFFNALINITRLPNINFIINFISKFINTYHCIFPPTYFFYI